MATDKEKIEEAYNVTEDGQLDEPGVHTRHPNRNDDKHHERTKSDGRRSSISKKILTQGDGAPKRDNHVRESQDSQQHFFVLILSKKKAKFFRGDLGGLKHIEISELPNGIDDVVHLEEKNQKLFRVGTGGSSAGANYHGMGGGTPDDKDNISMYLKEVDRTLWSEGLNKEKAPLVLGGVEYVVAIYKDISQYKYIADKVLTGSLENEDPKEIYKKAKEIISPITV